MDTNQDKKISFQQFQVVLVIEPQLARCFVAANETDPDSSEPESTDSLEPLLTSSSSRASLLASIPHLSNVNTITASHTMIGSDSTCCTIS